MPEPTSGSAAEPVVVTEGTPTESPAAAALNHAAPPDASATQEELNARIDESLGIIPAPKTEKTDDTAAAGTDPGETKPVGEEGAEPSPGAEPATDSKPADVQPSSRPEEAPKPSDQGPQQAPAASTALTLEVEDAAGTKYQIEKIEDLPEDFTPKNNRQVIQIIGDLNKLEVKREAAADAEKVAQSAAEAKASEQATLTSWDSEIAALQKDSRLDKPKATPGSPGFLEDPAVKRVDQVFKFMKTENEARAVSGVAPIRSFSDALDKIELQELRAAKTAATKQETQNAKAKSGLIGRTSAGGSDAAPVYRAGQARDIWDV